MGDTTYYITTPIYYVNDLPHIGHIYTTVMADVFARYHRMLGHEVRFLTGTDEHGQKIERAAEAQGIRPIELADRVVARYHELWKQLEISHDDFIRTTEERHRRGVTEIIRRIQAAGDIYQGEYSGWYCSGCEAFYPETQLVEGRCPDQGHPVELLSEPSYFFRLSAYQEPLLEWYREHPGCIEPRSRYNEVLRFVEGGLRDLSISRRSLTWGVPFPGDPDHVVYVWLDALTNYLSALGFGSDDDTLYRRFWPAQLHLVGKDILRFHCVYWPAFLMSAGLPLPEKIFGHGWWMRDEAKMSKSLGNVVRPDYLMERFGPDPLRYFLAREMTFGLDASFSDEAFLERYNADLANNLGNAVSRTLSMTHRYLDGTVPAPGDGTVAEAAARAAEGYLASMDTLEPHRALEAGWQLLDAINGFIQERQPWSLAKGGDATRPELEEVLGTALEGLRIVSLMISPFMPGVAATLRGQLGLAEPGADLPAALRWRGRPGGTRLGESRPLFPRVDIKAYLKEVAMENEKQKTPTEETSAETAPVITIDEFAKVTLKAGVVREAERIPKSKKLLRLMVDLGEPEPRQIVAGIAEAYEPDQLVGRRIVVVANLKPVKLMGVESRGMVLAATDAGGRPYLLSPDGEVPPGAEVR
ncbi:MAG TPA: methionine--tRNA ligase [Acidobacteria bacterium]|nr:methionine--tRNA ligase [Acidobacteriota bacterium]